MTNVGSSEHFLSLVVCVATQTRFEAHPRKESQAHQLCWVDDDVRLSIRLNSAFVLTTLSSSRSSTILFTLWFYQLTVCCLCVLPHRHILMPLPPLLPPPPPPTPPTAHLPPPLARRARHVSCAGLVKVCWRPSVWDSLLFRLYH